ncbi:hypothetical protein KKA85_01255, partial [bacterium]|nr:hypothetical protein [bacterium]
MTKLTKTLLGGVALLALLAAGCSLDTPDPATLADVEQPEGAEYFANYVAIGNSLTSGFMDAGLVTNGQVNSYPQLLASVMGAKAYTFQQPLIAFPGIGSSSTGDPSLVAGVLHFDGAGISLAGTTALADVQSTLLLAAAWPVPYNNLGVPGATTLDVTSALGSGSSQSPGNSYFDFILRNPSFGDVSMINQAIALGPKLITCWIGNNDILGGATGGEPEVGINITPTAEFNAMFTDILDGLTVGVTDRYGYEPAIFVGNVPGIASAPYFVPKALFDVMAGNPIPTEETAVYVRFPALGYLAAGGPVPLPPEWTLDAGEVGVVDTAVTEFNAAIAAAVAARDNVWLYDANTVLAGLDPNTEAAHFLALVGTLGIETAAATTYFSLDGIHPNNRGYALVANGFSAVINGALGTALPQIDIGDITWDPTYDMLPKQGGPLLDSRAAAA